MKRISLSAAAAVATMAIGPHANAAELTVIISGATPAKGQFLVSVFNSQVNWMKNSHMQDVVAVTSDGSGRAALDVPPGSYGIAIIHDANGDGKINTNALGIPTEAFGFSNNAKAGFGPPGFRRAVFDVAATGTAITIQLESAP